MLRAPAMRGGFASAWRLLAAPATSGALALAAAAGVVAQGLTGGGAGIDSPTLQLALALLPFSVAACAWEAGRVPGLVWAAGLGLAGFGAVQAGSAAGVIRLGQGGPVETYARRIGRGTTPVHLGGTLSARQTPEGLSLSLGTGEHVIGAAVVPAHGPEGVIGPWAVHRQADGAPAAPTAARLTLKPRAGDGAPVTVTVAEGSAAPLPDGGRIEVGRLAADFGRTLGPAAQIILSWPAPKVEGAAEPAGLSSVTDWHFVAAPELDARLGQSPWVVQLEALEAAPAVTLGVRRRGPLGPLLAGLGLMVLGLGLGAVGRWA